MSIGIIAQDVSPKALPSREQLLSWTLPHFSAYRLGACRSDRRRNVSSSRQQVDARRDTVAVLTMRTPLKEMVRYTGSIDS